MITEDYVSFETAKLLKEKGFDAECDYLYIDGKLVRTHGYACNWNDGETLFADYKNECSAPTLQTAMKWIQEAFNIIIIPDYEYECTSTSWCYKIFKLVENGKPERVAVKGISYDKDNNPTEHIVCYRDYERSYKDYTTKEEAVKEGIKYCLENLI